MWKLAEEESSGKGSSGKESGEKKTVQKEMRAVFVETLQELMDENPNILAIDADLGGASGFTKIRESHPEQFLDVGIAEANMVGVAAGLSMRGFLPYIHTFAPFISRRAADQLYLAGAYSHNTINIFASDPGICAAANGGTHTAFEDLAYVRALPETTIFDPADAVQLRWVIRKTAQMKGIHYIRANRKAMKGIYEEGSEFEIGKGNVLIKGEDVLLISMGETLNEAIQAARMLEREGISVEVADIVTLKPLDKELILTQSRGKKLVVTLENHSVINGLGSAVAEVLSEAGMGVVHKRMGIQDRFGQVGSLEYLKKEYGLRAEDVCRTIRGCMKILFQRKCS